MYSPSWICIYLILIRGINYGNAIHFGTVAEEGMFPYMAFISEAGISVCGGAVLDSVHILTAAHCVVCSDPRNLVVIAGAADWMSSQHEVRFVRAKHIHENFKAMERDKLLFMVQLCLTPRNWRDMATKNDIAVLTLNEPLPLGGNIIPVMLPIDDFLPSCMRTLFAGWGLKENGELDSSLRFMELYPTTRDMSANFDLPSADNQFDALDMFGVARTDRGDSGGPLVSNNCVYGILSSGSPQVGGTSVFTQVYPYMDFIGKIMTEDLE